MKSIDAALTDEERALIAAESDLSGDPMVTQLRGLADSSSIDLDFTDRVMARVGDRDGLWGRVRARFARPVSRRSSLLITVPVMAAVILLTMFIARDSVLMASKMPSDNLHYAASDLFPVEFAVPAPAAKRVTLSGDFNNWKPIPLADSDGDGVWTVSLTLAPGRYAYAYAVDGKRRLDPEAEVVRKNGKAIHAVLRL